MRILHVVHRLPPSVGGSQFYAWRLAKAQVAAGHTVTIATTLSVNPTADVPGLTTKGLTLRSSYPSLPREEIVDSVRIYRFVPTWQLFTYLASPPLARWVHEHATDFDVLHAHGYTFAEPWSVARARSSPGPRLIITGHDFTQPHAHPLYHALLALYHLLRGRRLLQLFDVCIADTEENRQDYLRLGVPDAKIVTIPAGVDYREFYAPPDKPVGDHALLFVARLVAYKGAQFVIQALPKIRQRFPTAKLVIVGEGQGYRRPLEALVQTLGLEPAVEFTGQIADTDLIQRFQSAAIFIPPSTNEGFGLVVLQAIAAGCYPILARVKALRFLIEKFGATGLDMADPETVPRQIAEAVSQLSRADRRERVQRMQQILEDSYSWEKVADAITQAY